MSALSRECTLRQIARHVSTPQTAALARRLRCKRDPDRSLQLGRTPIGS